MNKFRFLTYIFCLMVFSSCFKEEKYTDSQMGNFEALWKIMDENYCFFD